jgi:adenosylmethionine-8-amino-7-oxononanoate aminotransferase
MVGIDLGERDAAPALARRVVLEARRRGVVVRPLGETVVLMPPPAISKRDLVRLVEAVAESIRAACAAAGDEGTPLLRAA